MSQRLSLFLLYCLLIFGNVAYTASLTSFCITNYGSTSTSPVPTDTTTATTTSFRTITTTSTPRTTASPPPTTTTKTVTSTIRSTVTLAKTTNTYTSTVTYTSTTSTTTTSVVSTTTSVVTSTSTDTDPATATPSPGFTPLASVLSSSGYTVQPSPCAHANKRDDERPHVRDFGRKIQPRANGGVVMAASGGSISMSPSQYPTRVDCTSLYYAKATTTSTVTASTTSTISLNQMTVTSTSTTTTTLTSTKVPSGVALTTTSTTTTITSTVVVPSTSTTVSTTTTTAYEPSSTYYPACDVDNIVTCVNGVDQVSQILVEYNFYTISGPTDPQSCCIACSLDVGCGGSAWYPFRTACYGIIDDGMCDANSSFASFGIGSIGSPISLSNSNCGQFGFNGVVS